ncbi:MAG: hypothetical protein PVJ64_16215 [Gemmatimonadales bacterium]|jgi:hypothetical protein
MGPIRRAVALLLAIALPTVFGARLALDIRSATYAELHVEAKHGDICAAGHDHSLCAVIYSTPWSGTAPAPQLSLSAPPEFAVPLLAMVCDTQAQIQPTRARAPPSLTPSA